MNHNSHLLAYTLTVADRHGNVALTTPSAGHEYMYNKLGLLTGHKANNLYFNI